MLGSYGGAHVAQRRGSCSVCDSNSTCNVWVFRRIGIARVIQTSEQLDSLQARKVLLSWYKLEIKFTVLAGGAIPGVLDGHDHLTRGDGGKQPCGI